MSDLRALYQEVIVDHNQHPRNFHEMDSPCASADGYNPLCGDKLKLFLKIELGLITDASFVGKGCAISTASASLMTEALIGKSLAEAKVLFAEVHHMLTDEPMAADSLGKLDVLAGVKAFPSRVKCATLAWHTLVAALDNKNKMATTE